jgi:hypothetical protein
LICTAFDKPTFEQLLTDIFVQNANLTYWFLDPADRGHHLKMQEQAFMLALQRSTRTEDVLGLLASLRNPPPTSAEISRSNEPALESFHKEEAAFRHRQLRLTRFRALSLTVLEGERDEAAAAMGGASFSVPRASPTGARSCTIPADAFSLIESKSETSRPARSVAVYKKMSVWIEWKYYQPVGEVPEAPRFIRRRVDGLAKLLGDESKPDEFRVPQCLGYVHNGSQGRFGFVFKGRGSPKPLFPLSLRDMLESARKPALGSRVRMATHLAAGLWYLHATDWVHMGLRSDNVVFNDETEFAMGLPFFCGFEHVRPGSAGGDDTAMASLQHDVYRHPEAQLDGTRRPLASGFRKGFDIYSLGVVLFEIGLWRPVYKIFGLYPDNIGREGVGRVRENLLSKAVMEMLEAEAGERFAGVVRSCLEGEYTEKDGQVLVEFGQQVVAQLDGIVV